MVVGLVRTYFGARLRRDHRPVPPRKGTGRVPGCPALTLVNRDSEQTHMVLGVRAPGRHWEQRWALTVLNTVLGGGLKVSEVVTLRASAVGPRQEDGSLYINVHPEGAGRQHRTKVAPFAAGVLIEWLEARSAIALPGELLFPARAVGGVLHPATVYRHVAAVLAEAGIDPDLVKRRGARTLRNTFAIQALEAGSPPALVGEYLGHRADRSTRYYVALVKK